MKKWIGVLCVASLLLFVPAVVADEDKGDSKADEKRVKIDDRTAEALERLFEESKSAKELYEQAVGYAIFDNTKVQFIVAGGGGTGVAIHKGTGDRTYMKMGTGGVGLGIGAKTYQVILMFNTENVFTKFVEKGWQADSQASAAAGSASAEVKASFHNGVAAFVQGKNGLIASADISGSKYWQSDLNEE